MNACPHDLHPAVCITCARPAARRLPRAGVGPTFVARYDGDCPGCPDPILPGDTARRADRKVWHAHCAEVAHG